MSLSHDVLRLTRIPTTIAEICVLTGASRRDVEACVEELRLSGEPIIAGNSGLFLCEDPQRLSAYIQARRRRMLSEWKGTVALRRTLRRMKERDDLTLWSACEHGNTGYCGSCDALVERGVLA